MTKFGQTAITGNSIKPGLKRGSWLKLIFLFTDHHEGMAHRVFGIGAVAGKP
jgi:hypothetical protein